MKANSPICEFKRFRGKINIQRPQKPHFKRQLVMDVCKPIYPSKFLLPQVQQCSFLLPPKQKEANTVNPYEEILVNECANWFNHSKMIGIFHVNPLRMEDRFDTFKALKKQNMHIMNYGKKIIAKAIGNSPFKALQVLFETHTDIVFSEEIKVKQMLQITKGLRQLILIGMFCSNV